MKERDITWVLPARPLVIVESPYSGDIEGNTAYLMRCFRDCVDRGECPFGSHGFFPQFLDENNPKERELGIELGYNFWRAADIIAFYIDRGISKGMEDALNHWTEHGDYTGFRPKIEFRKLDK